jgi:hypothetical protein
MDSETRRAVGDDEVVIPELVDRVEYQAAELARLQVELDKVHGDREKLKTELAIARRWVQVLAREVELADLLLKEARPLSFRIQHPARRAPVAQPR